MRGTSITGIALALVLLAGCGYPSGGSKGPRAVGQKNGFGDPYISQGQAQSVQIGESPTAVFQALGGKANIGLLLLFVTDTATVTVVLEPEKSGTLLRVAGLAERKVRQAFESMEL